MITRYLRIAVRNLYLRRFYSLFNIIGLTIGLTTAAITFLYLRHELTYDDFFKQAGNTYRISGKLSGEWFAAMSVPYSEALCRKPFPEIRYCARFSRWASQYVRYKDKELSESKVLVTDAGSAFFDIFDFPFLEGNPASALAAPHSVVLTASLARELFGAGSAVGKLIKYDTFSLSVSGVIEDVPSNSHFDFRLLFTDARLMKEEIGAAYTYCIVAPKTDLGALRRKILSLPKPADEFSVMQDAAILPLEGLHFWRGGKFEMKPVGNRLYLYLFTLVGVMIVVISAMNYMNLSIAIYSNRKKEIAVRKVVGASSGQLALQFMTEALCLSLICVPLAITATNLTLPLFNDLMDVSMTNMFAMSVGGIGAFTAGAALLGVLSGSYPAWALPRLKAIALFRRDLFKGRHGLSLRLGLVTFQMVVLVIAISAGWMIQRQLNYVQEKDLGFVKEGVLKITNAWHVDSASYVYLKRQLLQHPAVLSVSQGYVPGDEDYGISFRAEGATSIGTGLIAYPVDSNYVRTMGIRLVGRPTPAIGDRLVLINQTLATQLGHKDPVGRKIILNPGKSDEAVRQIDGVFQDMNYFSLYHHVPPMLLSVRTRFGQGVNNNILVKLNTAQVKNTLAFIREKAHQVIPGIDVGYTFLDESLNEQYGKDQKLAALILVLLAVDIFLSVLGLFGLAAFISDRRTKEIGVRKVLGASVPDILILLSASFMKMAVVATLVGSAFAWLYIRTWLDNFAYRTSISWVVFLGTGGVLVVVTLLAIGTQALRAALGNPVRSLRVE